ncbi:MAG: undecaprenyl/decaprenyl-phosphate alpha-N-acetylglucosaminyl 1-phosphate transferase, partial [Caldilineaceae bacterium]|nr:undecaprenyl/decaprenyl-phosphate alpha-N-acetylglucosaminyl 1-phosphate transferase [Caldilineaceae bacterium]
MTPYLLMAASALVLAIGSTPVMRKVAIRYGVVDAPTARKIHASPVPLLGGGAIYVAFVLALLFLGNRFYINELVSIFVG